MRFLFRTLLAFCVAFALAGGGLAFLALEGRPLVESSPQLAAANFGRIERIVRDHDPRGVKPGTVRTLTLTEPELTLVTNHLLNYYGKGAASVRLERGMVEFMATLRVPGFGSAYFLNLRMSVAAKGGRSRVESVRLGRLWIPGRLAEVVLRTSLRFWGERDIPHLVQGVRISQENVQIVYRWEPKLLEAVRRRLVQEADSERLKLFHERLVELTEETGNRQRVTMKSLLAGLFDFALTHASDSPVADNRAIFVVLAAYVNRRSLEPLVPEARQWPRPRQLTLTLGGRKDLARHFLTSAALAVTGGGFLSDTMGIYKEIVDAEKGSGFSFTDLAADRAGTRFGELATVNAENARMLWQVFRGTVQEIDFMPNVKDLPEFMSASVFHQRFGEVGSPAYNRLAQEIEQRIDALSLYRQG